MLRKVREEEPAPPRRLWPDVPPALEALCLRALAKRPEDRPAAAAELAQEVQGWQEFERRKAEQALRESEALYRSLVDNLPCFVTRKDLEGRVTFANQRCCENMGRPLDQLLGRTDFDLCPPALAEKYRRDDQGVVATGEVFEDIEENVGSESKRYLHVLKTAVRDAAGKVIGVQMIAWDVTARKLAEDELRKSQERFELAVLASQDGLWDWDVENDQVWYSPRCRDMLGYDEQEFPNRPGETEKRVHPDDLARWRAVRDDEAAGGADHHEIEYRMRHKDGSYRWVRTRGVVLRRPDGTVYRVAGSREDITDRKNAEEALRQSEERYRSVIAAMQDGILIFDAGGGVVSWNAAAERILGQTAEQLMGHSPQDSNWRAVLPDGAPVPGENPAMITLRTGQPCTGVVMGVHKPDGTLTWVTVNAQPLFQADGRTLAGVAVSFEDITDRKRTEERLAFCERQLRRAAAAGEGGAARTDSATA